MKQFEYTITDALGIHARPAGALVKTAQQYESTVTLECNGKTANAKRLIAVMSLGAKQGHVMHVSVSGSDEENAAERFWKFLEDNL
ncbi:MAG: HPr family phosphocarrier protein [Treponema sp.]|nr:HPr family phosphocarrier protein [Treponema sp.]